MQAYREEWKRLTDAAGEKGTAEEGGLGGGKSYIILHTLLRRGARVALLPVARRKEKDRESLVVKDVVIIVIPEQQRVWVGSGRGQAGVHTPVV